MPEEMESQQLAKLAFEKIYELVKDNIQSMSNYTQVMTTLINKMTEFQVCQKECSGSCEENLGGFENSLRDMKYEMLEQIEVIKDKIISDMTSLASIVETHKAVVSTNLEEHTTVMKENIECKKLELDYQKEKDKQQLEMAKLKHQLKMQWIKIVGAALGSGGIGYLMFQAFSK